MELNNNTIQIIVVIAGLAGLLFLIYFDKW